jgi:hypothetical protein
VEGAVVAERGEEQLERFRFDQQRVGRIIDDDMGEIRLPGDGTQRGEFRAGEAHDRRRPVAARERHRFQDRMIGAVWRLDPGAELGKFGRLSHRKLRSGDARGDIASIDDRTGQ